MSGPLSRRPNPLAAPTQVAPKVEQLRAERSNQDCLEQTIVKKSGQQVAAQALELLSATGDSVGSES